MKNWLIAIGGVLTVILAIWLIVIFAPRVLLFLEGIVGILAGIIGGILLFVGIEGIRSGRVEKKEMAVKASSKNDNDQ